jgi:hypothetical protein
MVESDWTVQNVVKIATQPYVMDEDDSTPTLEEETKEEGDVTPPIEDVLAASSPYRLMKEVKFVICF